MLEQAYMAAEYWIEGRPPLLLRIGAPSPALDALLSRHGAEHGALITAANPRSRIVPEAANEAAHEQLLAQIAGLGLHHLPTRCHDPAGCWPDETGLFVSGIHASDAAELALRFDQNAYVWCVRGAAPALHWPAR